MKAVGIVVEYNPFHNGHKHHLEAAKAKGDLVIAVMSGDYVQRGEPALINKWKRAEMALKNGVDMVIELPVFYSTQSAEIFARGAIGMLEALKTDSVVFGSESSDVKMLEHLASLEEHKEFKEALKKYLSEGNSYPTAYSNASKEVFGEASELKPNDILGVEYIKAIKYWGSAIKPISIQRLAAGYHSEEITGNIASATAIRKSLIDGSEKLSEIVPEASRKIIMEEYESGRLTYLKAFYPLMRYEILKNRSFLKNIQDMEVGFENRLYESALINKDFESFYEDVLTKRFTRGRLQRILVHVLTGITVEMTEDAKQQIHYIRVLGFNKKGRRYLKQLEESETPILTTFKNIRKNLSEERRSFLEFNERASDIYTIINPYENEKIPLMIREEDKDNE